MAIEKEKPDDLGSSGSNSWRRRRDSNPRTWFRRPVLYPLSYRRLTKDIIAYSLSLLNCVALKLNGSENISFDAAARTYLEGEYRKN